MLLDGRGQATGIKRRGADTSLLMVFNAHHDVVEFTLPPSYEAKGWKRLFDTADPQLAASQFDIGAVYEVAARSMLLFERVPEKADRSSPAPSEGARFYSANSTAKGRGLSHSRRETPDSRIASREMRSNQRPSGNFATAFHSGSASRCAG